MTTPRLGLFAAIAFTMLSPFLAAQPLGAPQEGPTNHAVLLPPQTFEDAKGPNEKRDRHGQWSITGGVYFLQPVFETDPAFLVRGGGGNITRQVDFSHNLEVAPNVWIGYVSERGWGARGRWFQFDHDSNASYAAAPGESVLGISALTGNVPVAGGTVFANSNVAVNVADFQATCTLDDAKWSHLLGVGVRYTHMSQDYRANVRSAGTWIDLTTGHNLNAAGPSFSLETKRRLGESGFSIYGQLHGAILFGRAKENYAAVNNGVAEEYTRSQTDVLPVGEIELGGEYQRNMGRANLFLQVGFVGQVWWGGGNASNLDPIGFSSASNSNFGFLGIALRAGVRY